VRWLRSYRVALKQVLRLRSADGLSPLRMTKFESGAAASPRGMELNGATASCGITSNLEIAPIFGSQRECLLLELSTPTSAAGFQQPEQLISHSNPSGSLTSRATKRFRHIGVSTSEPLESTMCAKKCLRAKA
jgi:hypothetical protein